MVSFLVSLLLLFHFWVFLSQLSELVWKLAEEISLQSASKRFPSFGPPANGNKSNAKKSRFCPNRNLTGTIYHWSIILRSFSVVLNSAKCDANGFFKVLLLSSNLLISRHLVQKSKSGGCAVTGYCSLNRLLISQSNLQASETECHCKNVLVTLCVRKVIAFCVERLLHFALKILLHFKSMLLHLSLTLLLVPIITVWVVAYGRFAEPSVSGNSRTVFSLGAANYPGVFFTAFQLTNLVLLSAYP